MKQNEPDSLKHYRWVAWMELDNGPEDPPLYPFAVEEAERTRAFSFRPAPPAPYLILVFLHSGAMRYTVEEREFALSPGELLVIPRGSRYRFESPGGYRKTVLEVKGTLLDEYCRGIGLAEPFRSTPENPEELAAALARLADRMERRDPRLIPEIQGETVRILNAAALTRKAAKAELPPLLARAVRYIGEHLREPVSVETLASELAVSRTTLGALFRGHFAASPRDYWNARRMELADYQLRHSQLSIKEISWLLGYASQFHFTAAFTRRTGRSPSAVRRIVRNQAK